MIVGRYKRVSAKNSSSKAQNPQLVIVEFKFASHQDLGPRLAGRQHRFVNVGECCLETNEELVKERKDGRVVAHAGAAWVSNHPVTWRARDLLNNQSNAVVPAWTHAGHLSSPWITRLTVLQITWPCDPNHGPAGRGRTRRFENVQHP